jgi:erythromycin esterase-like protein
MTRKSGTTENKTQGYLPLQTVKDLDPLMERIGDSKFVLLGEASHGTHEYYTWRTAITKRLIVEKGFSCIAVEGDWPDCYKINRWVKGYDNNEKKIGEILHAFNRWPTWMWANWEIAGLAEWLKHFNTKIPSEKKVGFYGLDVYSLWESMQTMVGYLEKEDPAAAILVKKAIHCFEPYEEESYSTALSGLKPHCKKEVIELLSAVRSNSKNYDGDREAGLNAEINALVTANAERYYRTMVTFSEQSWNVRDGHMVETLNALTRFHGTDAKIIVWEHNTHIGDARATDMERHGLYNVGQLVREQHNKEGVVLVGFGSYQGSVIAGTYWDAPMEVMPVPPAKTDSVEWILHNYSSENKLLIFDINSSIKESFNKWLGHRAIGVVYNPLRERGNYVQTKLPSRYDAFLFIDNTKALHPLHISADSHLIPETYPFSV